MEATQMNVRLDRELKRAGDAVLAGHGYTPSCAVRALWEYLSVHAKLPDALERVLRQGDLEAAFTLTGLGCRRGSAHRGRVLRAGWN